MAINKMGLNILEKEKHSLSLYIHIPFCNSKCEYCAFNSMVANAADKKRYFNDLILEIKMQSQLYRQYYSVSSIYIGGGTPSRLDNYYIRDLLQCIYKNFAVKNTAEITIEVNPNTIERNKIREYILAGVNRFSVGLQSSSPKLLKEMGRTHTVEEYEKTISIIREFGIKNISTDIIIGYPKQKYSQVKETINYLLKLGIPHISVYMLQVEEGTKLKRLVDNGAVGVPSDEVVVDMYTMVCETLAANGYDQYELSNFAKPNFQSYHNKIYWQRKDYLGIGLSAHSYISGRRFANTDNILVYAKKIEEEKKIPIETIKSLTIQEKKEEFIMLSLRTSEGLDTVAYKQEFGENFLAKKKEVIAKLIKNEFMILTKDNKLICTVKGYLVLNQIVLELVDDL